MVKISQLPDGGNLLPTGDVPVTESGVTYRVRGTALISVNQYGAVGDGVTDCTIAFTQAIAVCVALGGGVVTCLPGVYVATSIVIPAQVIIDGQFVGSTELKLKDNTNADFVTSKNFASLVGTGKFYPTNSDVPYFFGLKDIRVNGNKANNVSGRGVCFYGNAQFLIGTVDVYDCAGDNIFTEASSSASLSIWQGQEEGFFDTVISRTSGGKGWLFHGPHNTKIKTYLCILAAGGGFGWYSESSATYVGILDSADLMHVYSASTNSTNRQGFYFGAGAGRISALEADSVSVIIDTPAVASGHVNIGTLSLTGVGRNPTNNKGLIVNDSQVYIAQIVGSTNASAVGCTFVEWNGSNGGCSGLSAFDNSSGAANLALVNTGSGNSFTGLSLLGFKGTGSVGITATSTFNNYEGYINNCKKGLQYTGNTGTTMRLQIFTNSGQVPVGGDAPSTSSRMDIRAQGTVVGGTYVSVVTSSGASNQIDLTSTAVQTITLAHTCLYTPAARNVQLTVSSTVTNYTWEIVPQFVSATSTNLTLKCKLGSASITGGAVADIIAGIRMGA